MAAAEDAINDVANSPTGHERERGRCTEAELLRSKDIGQQQHQDHEAQEYEHRLAHGLRPVGAETQEAPRVFRVDEHEEIADYSMNATRSERLPCDCFAALIESNREHENYENHRDSLGAKFHFSS